ncbi:MAG: oxaloacetate decarboxylase [Clostridia bacterium]|nr:oxaloacetate decarboxylase [Clostridia bacterium]
MEFNPAAVVENLTYMCVGMLGIFIVIGIIVLSVVVLNKATTPKSKD